jgi:hypothetical protein
MQMKDTLNIKRLCVSNWMQYNKMKSSKCGKKWRPGPQQWKGVLRIQNFQMHFLPFYIHFIIYCSDILLFTNLINNGDITLQWSLQYICILLTKLIKNHAWIV